MSEIKRYYFIDEIWQIIKEYLGINGGIKLTIPKLLSNVFSLNLYRILLDDMLYHAFDGCLEHVKINDSNDVKKSKMLKSIYTNYRLLNRCKKDSVIEKLESLLQPPKWGVLCVKN